MSKWDNLNFKKQEMSPSWDYKTQPKFVGKFIGFDENVGPNNSKLYHFELEDGTEMSIWGSSVLDVRFSRLKIGEIVSIKYLGQKTSEKRKGSKYHDFEVFHAAEDDVDINKEFDGKLPA